MIRNLWGLVIGLLAGVMPVQAAFVDIDTTHPHYHAIVYLQQEGVVEGYDINGKKFFRALQKVSRAEALKILLLGSKTELSEKYADFSDVPGYAWFAPYVGTAQKRNFVKGFRDGNFHPQAQVSRAEFLKMGSLAFGINITADDEETSAQWYEPYFDFAEALRVIDDGAGSPHENITRGEIAEIIYRLAKVADNSFASPYIYSGSGAASYYNEGFAGNPTASGEAYNPYDMTAAHRTLPFGTRLRVWTDDKRQSIVVRINDRGPYHSSRILDLSEKAFSELAPISRGVIEVNFEVFADEPEKPEIPEEVLPYLSAEARNIVIPAVVQDKLDSQPEPAKTKKELYSETDPVPVFSHIPSLGTDFYSTFRLRDPFPQKIRTGTTLSLAGTAVRHGHKKVTVFLQPTEYLDNYIKEPEQLSFVGTVSGKNFTVPVQFFVPGKYHMGVVFDDEKKSRVAEITVTEEGQTLRRLPPSRAYFHDEFDVHVIPEDRKVVLSWQNNDSVGQVNKLVFGARGARKSADTIYIEDGLDNIVLDYDFFADFVPKTSTTSEITLSIDWFAAESTESSLNTQTSNWMKRDYKNFVLVPGFADSESEKISVYSFNRFPGSLNSFTMRGSINDRSVRLPEHVFLILPNNNIKKIPVSVSGNTFSFRVTPDGWGTHILEIISDEGEILFNRALYFSQDYVLPVHDWERVAIRSNNKIGIKNWVNTWRQKYRLPALNIDSRLEPIAQHYAEQMALDNFIAHTSPTGVTFEDRIKNAGLEGEYAENLSFGTTLDIALDGLQDSASHFQQITNPQWKYIGIGLAQNKDGYYVVQVFGE